MIKNNGNTGELQTSCAKLENKIGDGGLRCGRGKKRREGGREEEKAGC